MTYEQVLEGLLFRYEKAVERTRVRGNWKSTSKLTKKGIESLLETYSLTLDSNKNTPGHTEQYRSFLEDVSSAVVTDKKEDYFADSFFGGLFGSGVGALVGGGLGAALGAAVFAFGYPKLIQHIQFKRPTKRIIVEYTKSLRNLDRRLCEANTSIGRGSCDYTPLLNTRT